MPRKEVRFRADTDPSRRVALCEALSGFRGGLLQDGQPRIEIPKLAPHDGDGFPDLIRTGTDECCNHVILWKSGGILISNANPPHYLSGNLTQVALAVIAFLIVMKVRWINLVVLLWLGWYISGPTAETFDFWDTPRQEMHDVARSGGGIVLLVGTAIAVALDQIRRLRKRLRLNLRPLLGLILVRIELPATMVVPAILMPSHSPPIQLRV